MRILPKEITDQIANLESEITAATASQLLVLQPKLHSLLRDLTGRGFEIPARLRHLDLDLVEDAVETQFDNLPL